MNINHPKELLTQEQSRPTAWQLQQPAWSLPTGACDLSALAARFDPISLAQMDTVALLNRTDTKFMMSRAQFLNSLVLLTEDYWMLAVNGERFNHYRSLYFDTPGFDLYNLHVTGRAERYKVRSREYTDSQISFLEVKHKTRKDRTIKDRLRTDRPVVEIDGTAENWLAACFPFAGADLEPKLWNTFTRLTLVSKRYTERVTLDLDLTFYTDQKIFRMGEIVIAEVKMDSSNQASPFFEVMRNQKIHPSSFSKYCIGISLLYDQVKKNALKPKLHRIEKITRGAYHD